MKLIILCFQSTSCWLPPFQEWNSFVFMSINIFPFFFFFLFQVTDCNGLLSVWTIKNNNKHQTAFTTTAEVTLLWLSLPQSARWGVFYLTPLTYASNCNNSKTSAPFHELYTSGTFVECSKSQWGTAKIKFIKGLCFISNKQSGLTGIHAYSNIFMYLLT